jgi:hypothetical protein
MNVGEALNIYIVLLIYRVSRWLAMTEIMRPGQVTSYVIYHRLYHMTFSTIREYYEGIEAPTLLSSVQSMISYAN